LSITKRIDAITGIGHEYRGLRLPAPKSVKIELTARCNYKCGFCVKSLRDDDREMDRVVFSQIIRDMRECGVEEIGLFYIGESFLCKWLPDAIRECKEVGFPYVFLTTNGSAALPKIVEECMKAGLDSLKFSLNFHSPQQLAEVAQVSSRNWQRAIDHLKEACRIRDEGGYACKVYASSIAFNGEQGAKMQGVIDEVLPLLDEHYFLPLYGMSGAAVNIGWKPRPGNPGRLDNMRDPLPCWAVFTEGHVTHDGKMVACCFGTGIDGDMVMGDLMLDDFMTAWNSKAYQRLREAHLNEDVTDTPCASCAAGS
jgi:radical SAM protein with 4Fe4S-binding SPASM domain